jgi:peptidoglycan/xylan/chitin deacetylase (PgdA/CDA1 family)
MKKMRAFVLALLAVAGISCASRLPIIPETVPETIPETVAVFEPMIRPSEEPVEPFERALWNIKNDTPLFKKYIEGGPALLSGLGIDGAENIIVKGEAMIDGNEFMAAYDVSKIIQIDKDYLYVPFTITNMTNGISRYDAIFWNLTENEAGLLFSLDDDYWNVWCRYFDLFDGFGAKITFFVQGLFEESLADFCFEAINRGHDLGFHSVNHPDLRGVSRGTFNYETIYAAEPFRQAGISFSAFGFPYGFSEPWMREALAPYFPFTRGYGTNIRFYDPETIASRYVISKAIDNIVFPDDDVFESDIRLMLLATKFTGSHIIPFTTHDISDTAQWGITPMRLEFVLRTAQELKLRFYTYSSAMTINNPSK